MTDDGHWREHVRRWALLGPPLRPAPEDITLVAGELRAHPPGRTLLLGATPELAQLAVAAGATTLLALDRSAAALATVLPPRTATAAVVADWRALPLPTAAADTVLADGALTCLPYPAGYTALAAELARVLAPGGRVVMRAFVAPPADQREALAAIEPHTSATIHALKWRVAMSAGLPTNLPVRDLLAAFDARFPDRAALAAHYSADAIATLDHYATSPLVYSFPTLADVLAAFTAFVPRVLPSPPYALGPLFPTLVFTAPTAAR